MPETKPAYDVTPAIPPQGKPDMNMTPTEPIEKSGQSYDPQGDEGKIWKQYLKRKREIMGSRKNISGQNIDDLMRRFDKNYFNRDADIPASELDPDQKPIAINNAFGKVQAALTLLIDRNPTIILDERLSKFSANRELMKVLANSSWKNTNSLGQFKLSVFNSAKRGWFVGRTLHRKIITEARFPKAADQSGKIQYEKRMITKMDDIGYINLDNHNVWIDEQARPEDMFSTRDAMHREIWHIDDLKTTFPEKDFPNMKWVTAGGNTQERVEGDSNSPSVSVNQPKEVKTGMTEVFFYENQMDDWFIIEANNIMIVFEPLPQNHKRLSYTYGHWNLRSAETIYGIGVVEAMERDETLIDRINNMSMRQLLFSINPPGFYSGTEDFENENIKLKAGVLRKTLNPKDITFVEIPEMKEAGLKTIDWIEGKEDQKTGITANLEGESPDTGGANTAFEVGVNREASLKRLRLPLRSLQYALQWEFMNRIDLIKQVYSDFDVQHLANEDDIFAYLEEVKADPDFFYIQNEGVPGQEKFFKKNFREVNASLSQDQKGNFIESDQNTFFKVKPEFLAWEGGVTIDMNSILVSSEELEAAKTLQMSNILIPMFQMPPEIALKPAKQILVAFNKDPKKWLPQTWVDQLEGKQPQQQQSQVPPNVQAMLDRQKQGAEAQPGSPLDKPTTVVPSAQLSSPTMGQRLGAAFRGFKAPTSNGS